MFLRGVGRGPAWRFVKQTMSECRDQGAEVSNRAATGYDPLLAAVQNHACFHADLLVIIAE